MNKYWILSQGLYCLWVMQTIKISFLKHQYPSSNSGIHTWYCWVKNVVSTFQRLDVRVNLAPADTSERWSSILLPQPHKGTIILRWEVVHPQSCFTWTLPAPLLTLCSSRCKVGGVTGGRYETNQTSAQLPVPNNCQNSLTKKDTALKCPHEKFLLYLCAGQQKEKLEMVVTYI